MSSEEYELNLDVIHQWSNLSLQLLYRVFYKALVGFAVQMTEEYQIAEDIVQEVFFKTWQKKNVFQTVGTLKAYLYNSTRNECINYLRHQQVRQGHEKRIVEEYREMRLDGNMELLLHKEEVYRQLFVAIDQLPPKQREIFLLAMKGKKNHEIAAVMGITLNTVKKQRQRGLESLRSTMHPKTFLLLLGIFY
jgi:RNA polymerase sigma-70 factor (ECF subfamily)